MVIGNYVIMDSSCYDNLFRIYSINDEIITNYKKITTKSNKYTYIRIQKIQHE